MIQDEVYTSLAGILKLLAILLLVVPTTWFPLAYSHSNWRATMTGRGLMWSSIALALAVDQSAILLVCRTFGVELGYLTALTQFGVFVVMNVTAWRMLVNLLRIQRRDRLEQDARSSHPNERPAQDDDLSRQ